MRQNYKCTIVTLQFDIMVIHVYMIRSPT